MSDSSDSDAIAAPAAISAVPVKMTMEEAIGKLLSMADGEGAVAFVKD